MSNDLNCSFILSFNKFKINDNLTGNNLLYGKGFDGLYQLNNSNNKLTALYASTNNNSNELWHKRCGHPSAQTLSRLL